MSKGKHTCMAHVVAFATIRKAKTREHLRKVLTQRSCEYVVTDNVIAQHKNCPSTATDDRPGRDLFRVLKRPPTSQPHALGLRRSCSDGKTVGNTTGFRRRLQPHWIVSLLQSLCRTLGPTEASYNF